MSFKNYAISMLIGQALIIYVLTAFVLMELNPIEWGESVRTGIVVYYVISFLMSLWIKGFLDD